MHIKFNGSISNSRQLHQGLPQVSVLSPLLCIFYINNLATLLPFTNNNFMFADNVFILATHPMAVPIEHEDIGECPKQDPWQNLRSTCTSPFGSKNLETNTLTYQTITNRNCMKVQEKSLRLPSDHPRNIAFTTNFPQRGRRLSCRSKAKELKLQLGNTRHRNHKLKTHHLNP